MSQSSTGLRQNLLDEDGKQSLGYGSSQGVFDGNKSSLMHSQTSTLNDTLDTDDEKDNIIISQIINNNNNNNRLSTIKSLGTSTNNYIINNNSELNIQEQNSQTMNSSLEIFDDLEFLQDFLDKEANAPWFEANCFKLTCKNVTLFILFCVLISVLTYVIIHFGGYNNYLKNHTEHVIKLVSIPVVCVVFTYSHIALALWMTFYPVEFFGIYQFKSGLFAGYGLGWQGIVPMKAIKMAHIAVDLMVPDVIRVEDIIKRIEPDKVSSLMEPATVKMLEMIIPKIAKIHAPAAWALLPENLKKKMIELAVNDAKITAKNMILDINKNFEEVFDLKDMVGVTLQNDKELLSNIFLKCGRKEMIFIRNFGGVLGLILGLGQMLITIFFSKNKYFHYLTLPVSGFILGWLTNWIALKLIFRPIEAIKFKLFFNLFGPEIVIQGLFLKRQREVAVEFANFISNTVMKAEVIFRAMLNGKSANKLYEKVQQHLADACDRFSNFGKIKPILEFALGSERFEKAKIDVIDSVLHFDSDENVLNEVKRVQKKIEEYCDDVMNLEVLLRSKMASLSPKQFEGVLHPVFQEDEIKLIFIGAMLGLFVGIIQVFAIGN